MRGQFFVSKILIILYNILNSFRQNHSSKGYASSFSMEKKLVSTERFMVFTLPIKGHQAIDLQFLYFLKQEPHLAGFLGSK